MSPSSGSQTAQTEPDEFIIGKRDLILITGATGFMGSRLVANLVERGYRNLRCFTRPSSDIKQLSKLASSDTGDIQVDIVQGNLLSPQDCATAANGASVIYHLAAQRGEKSYPDAFMNSVVTARNLLDACVKENSLKRFVNVSSFAVYSNEGKIMPGLLDETCPVEMHPEQRGDAYCFAKVNQDEIIFEYGRRFRLPYVVVRPGAVYGAGNLAITGRVGIDNFGIFLHLGGSNPIPLTYVDNCVDAIVLTGLYKGIDGEIFNIVDDELPTSRQFLRLYKRNVKQFKSLSVPHFMTYALCALWEKYSNWSEGQLPAVYNRKRWHAMWKKTSYSNEKLKTRVGWKQKISTKDGLDRYFEACRAGEQNA